MYGQVETTKDGRFVHRKFSESTFHGVFTVDVWGDETGIMPILHVASPEAKYVDTAIVDVFFNSVFDGSARNRPASRGTETVIVGHEMTLLLSVRVTCPVVNGAAAGCDHVERDGLLTKANLDKIQFVRVRLLATIVDEIEIPKREAKP